MKATKDAWFIRLPDGREMKAKTTRAVEHHLLNGAIPLDCRVRRSAAEEWTAVEWTAEFMHLAAGRQRIKKDSNPEFTVPAGVASRLDPLRLRTLGVRGLWEDLIAALDSTFTRKKLGITVLTAGLTGMVVALILSAWVLLLRRIGEVPNGSLSVALGLMVLAAIPLVAALNALLARLVHVEMSFMRPATWTEARRSIGPRIARLAAGYLLLLGGSLLLIQACRWAPGFGFEVLNARFGNVLLAESVQTALAIFCVAVEILLWFVVGLCWLLAPVVVVEEGKLFESLKSWARLVHQHLGRLVVGETLALATGALVTLPFTAPVWLGLALGYFPLPTNLVGDAVRGLLIGISVAPFLAFVAVANVLIYLDVKYESER